MKTKIGRIVLLFIFILAFVALAGYYRSFIDGVNFLESFDKVLINFSEMIWTLLQNSIVLTGIVITIVFWALQDNLPKILSVITEVRAGSISAKIDSSKLFLNIEKNDRNEIEITAAELIKRQQIMVDEMPFEICEFILAIADKQMTFAQHVDYLSKSNRLFNKWDSERRIGASLAYSYTVAIIYRDILFDVTPEEDNDNIHIRLKTNVKDLIEKKMEQKSTYKSSN